MRRLPLRSPPRMRGKVCHTMAEAKGLGITPACAGKSGSLRFSSGQCRDHPRVCGEKVGSFCVLNAIWGSPPRVRGKADLTAAINAKSGITPACAGKRADCPTWGCTGWDHPRVCGEKMCIQCSKSIPQGSPPRMRGKGCLYFLTTSAARITPAYAGKSDDKADDELNAEGSPPRMRGKAPSFSSSLVVGRITPAYAGKR